jgi:hypothetical protein
MTRAAARSRADYLAASKSRLKPWVAEGLSRRTWYRQNSKAGTNAREAIPPFGTSPNETSARRVRETSALVSDSQPAVRPSLPSQTFVAPAAPELTPTQFAAARAAVDLLLASMSTETERRRDWYAQPVEGWREGRLTIHSIDGETTAIELSKHQTSEK